MSYIRRDGAELFYRLVGTGEPCLVMHGGLGLDHTCMSPFLDVLGDVFRLAYYDHRGNGQSSRENAATMTFDDLLSDADAMRETALDSARSAVIASSYGGFLALQYALRFPERVTRLVLVGTAPTYSYFSQIRANIEARGGSQSQVHILEQDAVADDAWLAAKFRLLGPLYFHNADPELPERVFGRTHWSGVAAKRSRELSVTYDIREDVQRLKVPTLITVGADDFITPPSQAMLLNQLIPESRLVVFEKSGHFPFVEEPGAFGRVVREWLRETGR